MKKFSILLNGKEIFQLEAKEQISAVMEAQADPRYLEILSLFGDDEFMIITAKEIEDNSILLVHF